MSLNLNHIVLAGHLTRDPELRQVNAERACANFGLAVNRTWKNAAGEKHEEATFVDLEAWGRTAELVGQYLKKGSPVYVEGRLRLDTWDDKESGQKRSRLKVVVETVQFLAARPQGGETGGEGGDASEAAAPKPAPSRPAAPPRRRPAPAPVESDAPF
jgi:single-strand DNA-binding protein